MKLKSMDLVWIMVNDIKKAVKFYTETLGLTLKEFHEEYGWAELEGKQGGSRIGLGQFRSDTNEGIKPGQNAVMTFTVENLAAAIATLNKEGTNLIGPVQDIPGHVKLQMVEDADGNLFQLAEMCHKCGCSNH